MPEGKALILKCIPLVVPVGEFPRSSLESLRGATSWENESQNGIALPEIALLPYRLFCLQTFALAETSYALEGFIRKRFSPRGIDRSNQHTTNVHFPQWEIKSRTEEEKQRNLNKHKSLATKKRTDFWSLVCLPCAPLKLKLRKFEGCEYFKDKKFFFPRKHSPNCFSQNRSWRKDGGSAKICSWNALDSRDTDDLSDVSTQEITQSCPYSRW